MKKFQTLLSNVTDTTQERNTFYTATSQTPGNKYFTKYYASLWYFLFYLHLLNAFLTHLNASTTHQWVVILTGKPLCTACALGRGNGWVPGGRARGSGNGLKGWLLPASPPFLGMPRRQEDVGPVVMYILARFRYAFEIIQDRIFSST